MASDGLAFTAGRNVKELIGFAAMKDRMDTQSLPLPPGSPVSDQVAWKLVGLPQCSKRPTGRRALSAASVQPNLDAMLPAVAMAAKVKFAAAVPDLRETP